MTVKEFKNSIRLLIKNDNTTEAIAEIESYCRQQDDEDVLNMLTVIQAEYKNLSKKIVIGNVITSDENRQKNDINYRLLAACGHFEDKTQSTLSETKAACKAAYLLLVYLSENTNSKTVFYEDAHRQYFLRRSQGNEFIDKLTETYLSEGFGLYLPKEVIADFYTFRAKVYKIIEHAKWNDDVSEMIEVTNPCIKKLVKVLCDRIAVNLKKHF